MNRRLLSESPMTILANICCVAAMILGLLSSLAMAGLLLAGSANITEAQQANIRLMLITTVVVGVLCLGGAIWAMVTGKPWVGAGVGAFPSSAIVALVMWVTISKLL
ncbi:MAG: hypothetical protein H7210_03475 [Pyrinomonadaceae bacterium]|nr:hypothetical protein [Phycisphaerales bacterium]